jgi:hypothetical protein
MNFAYYYTLSKIFLKVKSSYIIMVIIIGKNKKKYKNESYIEMILMTIKVDSFTSL